MKLWFEVDHWGNVAWKMLLKWFWTREVVGKELEKEEAMKL
jgi:hypothetical protein